MMLATALLSAAALAPLASALDAGAPERWILGVYEMPDVRPGDVYHLGTVVAMDADLRYVVVETANAPAVRASALTDANVRYVEYDDPAWAHLLYTPNDPKWTDAGHYGPKIIGATVAWDKTLGSTAVKVGVLDTGIRRDHEDFVGGRVLQGWDFYNNDNNPNDEGGMCSYHGSHTAGTVGATTGNGKGMAGMAQVTLLPVKAFGGFFCGGSTTALANGLKYIADQGGHVSSNSWGSSASSSTFNSAIDYAHGKGTIHVAAAGNSGSCTDCVSYPWKDRPAVTIVVSAIDSSSAFASFSSQGPQVDVAAPGVGVLSVNGGGTTGYKLLDGTSMACPHVSGVVALVKTLNPSFSFSQVEGRLTSTADDLGPAGKDDRFGYGRVDAAGAVY
ncbi:MAG TPA: S8 family serine peptidase [Candidatus Thermoplasmatota archaeon]|nr:S8 family serine peptidase [Candidatus Thermoplasmatota archaeon]